MAPLLPSQLRPDADGRFESVYRAHVRDVYGFALGLLGNVDDAEDVTQTTFLNAFRALNRGEDVRNLRAWLLAIAHNVCRQRFRTAARRPREVELDPDVAEVFVDEDAPSAADIRAAMRQLSFNQRTVLVLREIEGLSYDEIAQAMDTSLSAVETLLFRARRALREQLEAAENELGCNAAERLVSLQLDGKLSRQDRGLLRAHLRTCAECARVARSQRARKRVMPSLVAVPLPASLNGAFGIGAGGGGAIVTAKAAAVVAGAALAVTGVAVKTGGADRSEAAEPPAAALEGEAFATSAPAWSPFAAIRRLLDVPGRAASPVAAPRAGRDAGGASNDAPRRPGRGAAPRGSGKAAAGASQQDGGSSGSGADMGSKKGEAAPGGGGGGAAGSRGSGPSVGLPGGGSVGTHDGGVAVTPPSVPVQPPSLPDIAPVPPPKLPPLPVPVPPVPPVPPVAPSLPPVKVPVPDVGGALP